MSEQEKIGIDVHIAVTLSDPPVIRVNVRKKITVGKNDKFTEYFLERIGEYLAGEETTSKAINKAAQDFQRKIVAH
ncbi:TPA: hypothetical protein I8636_002506 [Morganella morganii]|nr:hypothetical protein [Morganella morganii]